jgi:hypothetical protein
MHASAIAAPSVWLGCFFASRQAADRGLLVFTRVEFVASMLLRLSPPVCGFPGRDARIFFELRCSFCVSWGSSIANLAKNCGGQDAGATRWWYKID